MIEYFSQIDPDQIVTISMFFLAAMLGPLWVVHVVIKAERRATKRDIEDAFTNIKEQTLSRSNGCNQ